jgi:AcrR family transcriptional regulator
MTEQGDPVTRRQPYNRQPARRRRNKLALDPDVRRAIIVAASKSVRENGLRGLSVAAVLARAQLSTRAFYRHFESKDQLVAAVFLEMTRIEVLRLRRQMAEVSNPIRAVAAWIDGRLDLAFDEEIKSELLEPLVEQLQRGMELGVFEDIVPATAAKSINGVVWAATQRQWATNHWQRDEVRERVLRFCLRGLGVVPETIERVNRR